METPAPTEELAPAEEAAPEETPASGGIRGFLWNDGNGMSPTDWNGLYDGSEQPLVGYPVSLYLAEDLTAAIAATTTAPDGTYAFDGLAPGNYVVALSPSTLGGMEWLLPFSVTAQNKFAIDWSSDPLEARTTIIALEAGQVADGIGGGMRLPMGVQPLATVTLANLKNANVNDTVTIDGYTWFVVKKQTVGSGATAVNCIYLIMQGSIYSSLPFSNTSTDYTTSLLRNRMNSIFGQGYLPTIKAIAMKANLGDHSSNTAISVPTGVMAGSDTTDVLFAPSYREMFNWTGGDPIPPGHPLYITGGFPRRFLCRTARTTAEVYGVLVSANSLDGGINYNGYSTIWDVPAVWVNGDAVERKVNVYYIDTDGNPIGTPPSATYTVIINNTFTLTTANVPTIPGYTYKEWRKGLAGAAQSGAFPSPTLSAAEVINGTDLYLVFEKVPDVDVTITKTISGKFADMTRTFAFTVYLQDASGGALGAGTEIPFVGGTLPGSGATAPADGKLTLQTGGTAGFNLGNGQTITLKGLPSGAKIRIVETTDGKYTTSFADSAGASGVSDTDYRTVGSVNRTFDFTNARIDIVPTGIDEGVMGTPALLAGAALLLLTLAGAGFLRRGRGA